MTKISQPNLSNLRDLARKIGTQMIEIKKKEQEAEKFEPIRRINKEKNSLRKKYEVQFMAIIAASSYYKEKEKSDPYLETKVHNFISNLEDCKETRICQAFKQEKRGFGGEIALFYASTKEHPINYEEYKVKVLNRLLMLRNSENAHLLAMIVDEDITPERVALAQPKVPNSPSLLDSAISKMSLLLISRSNFFLCFCFC